MNEPDSVSVSLPASNGAVELGFLCDNTQRGNVEGIIHSASADASADIKSKGNRNFLPKLLLSRFELS